MISQDESLAAALAGRYRLERPLGQGGMATVHLAEDLKHLLCHPAGRTRDQIGLAFWRDASHAQLKNNFHVTLHHLRSTLGRPDWIVFEEELYRINPRFAVEFDGLRFEAELRAARAAVAKTGDTAPLARALARYRGDFLEDAAAEVGDWHLEHQERWRRLYVAGQLALREHGFKAGP